MAEWTPEVGVEEVTTTTRPVIQNMPEPGTRARARMGRTVIDGMFEKPHTKSDEFVAFRTKGVTTGDLLWIRDGWTFELLSDEELAEEAEQDALEAQARHEENLPADDEREFF
jgi:hypothetical protein